MTVTTIGAGSLEAAFRENLATNATPEWWLAGHGFTDNFNSAALGDPDRDGAPTWTEFHADTIPTDGASVLKVVAVAQVNADTRIDWKGGTHSWQVLEFSRRLETHSSEWSIVVTNVPPTRAATNYVHLSTQEPMLIYRIRAWRQ